MARQKRFQSLQLVVALILFPVFCNATDTISPSQLLRDGETLVSSGENFALGFFSPGNSNHRYVGIWYNKIPGKEVVWVANRGNPVADSTGILRIEGCNLALIIHEGLERTILWSTSTKSTVENYSSSATLLDSGNLVLRDNIHQRVLWESFDYLTNTILPGMRFGLDRRTGLNRVLTSWRSRDDPAPGEYSLGLDPLGGAAQYLLMKGSDRIWRSGPWIGRRFTGTPEKHLDPSTYGFVSSYDEIYYRFNIINNSFVLRFLLDISGVSQILTWNDRNRRWSPIWLAPRDICDQYGYCGAFGICDPSLAECVCLKGFHPKAPRDGSMRDWTDGCVRNKALDCEGKGDGFLKLERVKLPDTSTARVEPSLSLQACEKECLKNCSCTAYATANISGEGSSYVIWYGDLIDVRVMSLLGESLYLRVPASELDIQTSTLGIKKKLLITVPTLIVVSLVTYCYFNRRNSKGHLARQKSDTLLDKNDFEDNGSGPKLPMFHLSVIKAATNNFSEENMLGEGGFGPVYKGKLLNGQEIAVKRLSKKSKQGAKEFKNEVALIAKLQHKNLVRLLGYCIHKQEKMLIYEFMRNKSLDTFIFDHARRVILDWRTRFNIILGIARGVLYLHEDSRFKVIHRDLKVSNILLDDEMNPKISDFGLAREFAGEQTFVKTNKVAGTYGYMSPEYAMSGRFSVKSDVFSFGVLLLEIISGRRNNDIFDDCLSINLIGHAWQLWTEGSTLELVDFSLKDSCCRSEVLRCIQVGLLCVQESAKDRPNISYVVFLLGNEVKIPSPKQPAFYLQNCCDYQGRGNYSNNEVTITELKAR